MSIFGPPPLSSLPIWQDVSELKQVDDNPLNGKRLAQVIQGSVIFAGMGYGVYWIIRFVDKKKWFDINPKAIHPVPYMLVGVINAAVPEITTIVCDFVLYFMGKRKNFENLADPANASYFDHMRHHCWGVVRTIEGLEEKVDKVYSRIFHVRTSKEIRDNQIPDRELTHMEIVRYAIDMQVKETASEILRSVPGEIGVYTAEALGYTVLGGHFFMFFICLAPITAVMGIAIKVMQVKDRIAEEIWQEQLKLEAEKAEKADVEAEAEPECVGVEQTTLNDRVVENDRVEATK